MNPDNLVAMQADPSWGRLRTWVRIVRLARPLSAIPNESWVILVDSSGAEDA